LPHSLHFISAIVPPSAILGSHISRFFDFGKTQNVPYLACRSTEGRHITSFRKQTDQERQRLCEQLRKAREEASLNQGEAAQLLGIPQSILSKVESGERRIDMSELMAIAKVYGKDPAWFFGD
jgi:DNA-binding transcriptional regulator YiaG